MKWINRGRRTGKTTMLIYSSFVTGTPILVRNIARKSVVEETASKLGLKVDVCTLREWKIRHMKPQCVYIDEAKDIIEEMLENYLGAKVEAATMTIPFVVEIPKEKESEEE